MNGIKVATAVACSFLILLLLLVVFAENPQQTLYKKTIKTMMIHEGLTSEDQALEHSPELQDISARMERIAQLNSVIHSMTSGPAPDLSGEEISLLEEYREEISTLQTSVNDQLMLLMAPYTKELAYQTKP